jgi:hypothetical protein
MGRAGPADIVAKGSELSGPAQRRSQFEPQELWDVSIWVSGRNRANTDAKACSVR